MSIVIGNPKDGVYKLYLTEKFWLLKYFITKYLFNKKMTFVSKCKINC